MFVLDEIRELGKNFAPALLNKCHALNQVVDQEKRLGSIAANISSGKWQEAASEKCQGPTESGVGLMDRNVLGDGD